MSSRDHTALIIDGSDRGGIARYTQGLSRAIADQSTTAVSVLAPFEEAEHHLIANRWGEAVAGMPRWRIRLIRIGEIPRRTLGVLRALRATKPDVVHLQTGVIAGLDDRLVAWLKRKRAVVVTVHDAAPLQGEDARAARDRKHWPLADAVIVHSEQAADIVAVSVDRSRIHVIAPDVVYEAHTETKSTSRDHLGVSQDAGLVLFNGVMIPYKGISLLTQAWPEVLRRLPHAELHAVGSVPLPCEELDELLALEGVHGHLGWADELTVDRWMAAADVTVLPYEVGAHSGVMHRAVANGLPNLVSPSLGEDCERFAAGRVLERDPHLWADAIAAALQELLPAPKPPPRTMGVRTAALYSSLIAPPG